MTHTPTHTAQQGKRVRLQKALADAGIASRRHAEELIRAGRVSVNGVVVSIMGTTIVPAHDQIQVDGRPIHTAREHTYVMLHKPRRIITTVSDPHGRQTILDFVPKDKRLFPVGRLDADSEGLILLTDDGELANRLMHPRYAHEKEYRVLVTGRPSANTLRRLRTGIPLDDGNAVAARVTIEQHNAEDTWLRIVLREGRKRQIRRMMLAVGHRVKRLIRVRLGTLRLGDLPSGHWRALTPREVIELKAVEYKDGAA